MFAAQLLEGEGIAFAIVLIHTARRQRDSGRIRGVKCLLFNEITASRYAISRLQFTTNFINQQ